MFNIDFKRRNALVVGAARGIGAAVVRGLAGAGANVAFTYLDIPADNAAAAALEAELGTLGGGCLRRAVNCVDAAGTQAFAADIAARWGRVDLLVYAAGLTSPVAFEDLEVDEWRRIVDINLNGAFIAIHAVIGGMKDNGGAIVLIGSAAVVAGGGGRADYAAAKAGLEGLNRAVTKEFAPFGVRCNLAHPSLIETDLLRSRYPNQAERDKAALGVPARRLGTPEDVANAVLFLLSDQASYITGQSLYVDGGRTFCK